MINIGTSMTNFSLQDKVIVVTGGTGIIGQSFIKGITEAGGTVAILGRNEDVAKSRVADVKKNGGKAIALIADVLNEATLEVARDKVLNEFGRIDGLVNAAGGNIPEAIILKDDDIFGMNINGMRKAMELNLWGTLIPTQIFGKVMLERGKGSIVNISSMSSKRVITRVLGYSMGKAAIDCYTQWFAVELANRFGDKVRMNAIAPGFFLTEQNRALLTQPDGSYTERGNLVIKQTPFKRFGNTDELIGALQWLLSDASSFVTGTVINVDGGFFVNSGV
ncbi:SDR family oxidoreductase [Pedobacter insulae]|uniref:NAD(P)-dependent dehydrogenase, short-chain alcohol dehydrogenase family n=1 Tax=Pedobacter insulae TaxID=414048 RepID=A0A1I3A6I8_9SPHI|nr:SDR family oxidoreductase [Pedobacter insulae]SFH45723.1 NAD(P)-dependent dehydrogenase, short-chain alcohol dehydrogenase family [Pedobacter insulae]